jgi:hypothetical protein
MFISLFHYWLKYVHFENQGMVRRTLCVGYYGNFLALKIFTALAVKRAGNFTFTTGGNWFFRVISYCASTPRPYRLDDQRLVPGILKAKGDL